MRTEQQVFDYYYGEEGDGHKEYDYLCEEVDNFEELLSKFANIDFILSAPDVVANSIVSFEDECYKLLESMKKCRDTWEDFVEKFEKECQAAEDWENEIRSDYYARVI